MIFFLYISPLKIVIVFAMIVTVTVVTICFYFISTENSYNIFGVFRVYFNLPGVVIRFGMSSSSDAALTSTVIVFHWLSGLYQPY